MVKALVTTLPKSGTHLLVELLHELGLKRHYFTNPDALGAGLLNRDRKVVTASAEEILNTIEQMPDNSFVCQHLPHATLLMHALAERDVRVVALVRCPYDVIVSHAHHLLQRPQPETPTGLSLHAMQHWICSGGNEGAATATLAKRSFGIMHGWVDDPRVLTLHFEDIVGPRGSGRFSSQLAAGLKLREHLGLDTDAAALGRALVNSYKPEIALFRRGQIGSWKDEMAPNTAEQVRLSYGKVLAKWGYSLDGELMRSAEAPATLVEDMDRVFAAMIAENVHLRAKLCRMAEAAAVG